MSNLPRVSITPPDRPKNTVTLVMDEETAQVVRAAVGNIVGSTRARRKADAVYYALRDAGINEGSLMTSNTFSFETDLED
jgi:hypothetical protein